MVSGLPWLPLWAQAEPAPPETSHDAGAPGSPPASSAPQAAELPGDLLAPTPPYFAEAAIRLAQRPGVALGPQLGVGVGLTLGARWLTLWQQIELATALDFAYAQHRKDVQGIRLLPNGMEETFGGQRLNSENTFGALQTFMLAVPFVRPWVGVGGGVAVSYFSSDEKAFRPGSTRAYRPYGQFAGGIAIALRGQNYLNLRVDYHVMTHNPQLQTESGVPQTVFGDLVTVGVGFGSRLP